MTPALVFIFVLIISVMVVIFWMGARNAHKRDHAYKTALEHNQKKLDLQMSRINILSRALPNLQAALNDVKSADKWQIVALDEARALLWADGASYWSYSDKEQVLDIVVARGLNSTSAATQISLEKGAANDILIQAVTTRAPTLQSDNEIVSEPHSAIAMPLIVFGVIRGVFHFVRKGDDRLSARELDLMTMFVKQLALVLEHREMISNREKFYLELVQTLAEILDSRDASTQGQTKRARTLARAVARELDMPEQFVYYLEFAALLHDIGKLAIDESLLKKPGKLTPEEFEIVKKHPEIGYKILAPVTMLAPVAPMVLYHQEWFNGKGYPEGLSGEEIPLGARIVAILDAWAAMTSERPWRAALSIEQSLQEIRKGAGTQFDPKVVEAFVTAVEKTGESLAA
jgi:HD-GYP domain-containing protein (c-di-GMP phosphodiesterase class II)